MPKLTKVYIGLDFASEKEAFKIVDQLIDLNPYFKVGFELFSACGPTFVKKLVDRDCKVFLDLKYHDIPNTVARSIKQVAELGVEIVNLHITGGEKMVAAAVAAKNDVNAAMKVIGVTALTSMEEEDYQNMQIQIGSINQYVANLAKLAKKWGLDGVVNSAHEISIIKELCGNQFLTVVPGIRPQGSALDDQKRVMTPANASKLGADYLVIGRPITKAEQPQLVMQQILDEL